MKKKILFCYFAPSDKYYTPLDIAYIFSIHKFDTKGYDVEFLRLEQNTYNNEKRIKEAVFYLKSFEPDAIFFFLESVVWSRTYALYAAQKIAKFYRKKYGDKIFLGLQSYKITSEKSLDILEKKEFDCVVKKDPEYSFGFLDKILQRKKVKGVSYFDVKKNCLLDYTEPGGTPSTNLDILPSPFLEGVLDDLVYEQQIELKGAYTAYIATSRGCPFGCYYCFRSIKFDSMRYFSVQRFYDEIEYLLNKFKVFRFFVIDDCFMTSKDRLRDFVKEFKKRKKRNSDLQRIKILTMSRPELLDEESLGLLKEMHVTFIQIGLQSINPDLQKYITRNVEINKFKMIAEMMNSLNIYLKLDVIIGLPCDTLEYFKKTLDFAISLKPKAIQVKQLYHNPGTLFDLHKDKYEIELEKEKRDFAVPYVYKSKNVDEYFQKSAYDYLLKKMGENPKICWKWLSEFGAYYEI